MALFQRLIFGGAYIRRGLSTAGNLRFKINWASLIVGSKFTAFALFSSVFEGNFPSTSSRGLYLEGRFNGGLFALPVWEAYFRNFTVCDFWVFYGIVYGMMAFWKLERFHWTSCFVSLVFSSSKGGIFDLNTDTICMIFCYLPYLSYSLLHATSVLGLEENWSFAETVVFLNSSVNPFLYCWCNREIRTSAVKLVRKMMCKQTEVANELEV